MANQRIGTEPGWNGAQHRGNIIILSIPLSRECCMKSHFPPAASGVVVANPFLWECSFTSFRPDHRVGFVGGKCDMIAMFVSIGGAFSVSIVSDCGPKPF